MAPEVIIEKGGPPSPRLPKSAAAEHSVRLCYRKSFLEQSMISFISDRLARAGCEIVDDVMHCSTLLVLLTPGAFEFVDYPEDPVRADVCYALNRAPLRSAAASIQHERQNAINIVAVTCDLFEWPDKSLLPECLRQLRERCTVVGWSPENRESFTTQLLSVIDPELAFQRNCQLRRSDRSTVSPSNKGKPPQIGSNKIDHDGSDTGARRALERRGSAFYYDELNAHVTPKVNGNAKRAKRLPHEIPHNPLPAEHNVNVYTHPGFDHSKTTSAMTGCTAHVVPPSGEGDARCQLSSPPPFGIRPPGQIHGSACCVSEQPVAKDQHLQQQHQQGQLQHQKQQQSSYAQSKQQDNEHKHMQDPGHPSGENEESFARRPTVVLVASPTPRPVESAAITNKVPSPESQATPTTAPKCLAAGVTAIAAAATPSSDQGATSPSSKIVAQPAAADISKVSRDKSGSSMLACSQNESRRSASTHETSPHSSADVILTATPTAAATATTKADDRASNSASGHDDKHGGAHVTDHVASSSNTTTVNSMVATPAAPEAMKEMSSSTSLSSKAAPTIAKKTLPLSSAAVKPAGTPAATAPVTSSSAAAVQEAARVAVTTEKRVEESRKLQHRVTSSDGTQPHGRLDSRNGAQQINERQIPSHEKSATLSRHKDTAEDRDQPDHRWLSLSFFNRKTFVLPQKVEDVQFDEPVEEYLYGKKGTYCKFSPDDEFNYNACDSAINLPHTLPRARDTRHSSRDDQRSATLGREVARISKVTPKLASDDVNVSLLGSDPVTQQAISFQADDTLHHNNCSKMPALAIGQQSDGGQYGTSHGETSSMQLPPPTAATTTGHHSHCTTVTAATAAPVAPERSDALSEAPPAPLGRDHSERLTTTQHARVDTLTTGDNTLDRTRNVARSNGRHDVCGVIYDGSGAVIGSVVDDSYESGKVDATNRNYDLDHETPHTITGTGSAHASVKEGGGEGRKTAIPHDIEISHEKNAAAHVTVSVRGVNVAHTKSSNHRAIEVHTADNDRGRDTAQGTVSARTISSTSHQTIEFFHKHNGSSYDSMQKAASNHGTDSTGISNSRHRIMGDYNTDNNYDSSVKNEIAGVHIAHNATYANGDSLDNNKVCNAVTCNPGGDTRTIGHVQNVQDDCINQNECKDSCFADIESGHPSYNAASITESDNLIHKLRSGNLQSNNNRYNVDVDQTLEIAVNDANALRDRAARPVQVRTMKEVIVLGEPILRRPSHPMTEKVECPLNDNNVVTSVNPSAQPTSAETLISSYRTVTPVLPALSLRNINNQCQEQIMKRDPSEKKTNSAITKSVEIEQNKNQQGTEEADQRQFQRGELYELQVIDTEVGLLAGVSPGKENVTHSPVTTRANVIDVGSSAQYMTQATILKPDVRQSEIFVQRQAIHDGENADAKERRNSTGTSTHKLTFQEKGEKRSENSTENPFSKAVTEPVVKADEKSELIHETNHDIRTRFSRLKAFAPLTTEAKETVSAKTRQVQCTGKDVSFVHVSGHPAFEKPYGKTQFRVDEEFTNAQLLRFNEGLNEHEQESIVSPNATAENNKKLSIEELLHTNQETSKQEEKTQIRSMNLIENTTTTTLNPVQSITISSTNMNSVMANTQDVTDSTALCSANTIKNQPSKTTLTRREQPSNIPQHTAKYKRANSELKDTPSSSQTELVQNDLLYENLNVLDTSNARKSIKSSLKTQGKSQTTEAGLKHKHHTENAGTQTEWLQTDTVSSSKSNESSTTQHNLIENCLGNPARSLTQTHSIDRFSYLGNNENFSRDLQRTLSDGSLATELRDFVVDHECQRSNEVACYGLVCPRRLASHPDELHYANDYHSLTNRDVLYRRRISYLLAVEAKAFLRALDSAYLSACKALKEYADITDSATATNEHHLLHIYDNHITRTTLETQRRKEVNQSTSQRRDSLLDSSDSYLDEQIDHELKKIRERRRRSTLTLSAAELASDSSGRATQQQKHDTTQPHDGIAPTASTAKTRNEHHGPNVSIFDDHEKVEQVLTDADHHNSNPVEKTAKLKPAENGHFLSNSIDASSREITVATQNGLDHRYQYCQTPDSDPLQNRENTRCAINKLATKVNGDYCDKTEALLVNTHESRKGLQAATTKKSPLELIKPAARPETSTIVGLVVSETAISDDTRIPKGAKGDRRRRHLSTDSLDLYDCIQPNVGDWPRLQCAPADHQEIGGLVNNSNKLRVAKISTKVSTPIKQDHSVSTSSAVTQQPLDETSRSALETWKAIWLSAPARQRLRSGEIVVEPALSDAEIVVNYPIVKRALSTYNELGDVRAALWRTLSAKRHVEREPTADGLKGQ